MSGVHVLLVSLFGIPIVQSISHFFGRPKKIWLTTKNFGIAKKNFGIPKRDLVDRKKKFCRPKKWEIDQTIGIPKRLTKSTWMLLFI